MALAALVPLPFDVVFTVLRFWIRSKRNAWGPDDWAMLVNLVRLSLNLNVCGTDVYVAFLDSQYHSHHSNGLEWHWRLRCLTY